ncbi:uncharacterized protein [Montipora capricornis]|uniref:uncharacterized protein n=1 Tax=Montipora capricornis TaxID=246305 RepID=UPI0035F1221E
MAHLLSITFICCFLASIRSVTSQCEVSLPQETSEICKATRDNELATKKVTFTYKFNPSLHGFALLNMTPGELAAVLTQDPFSRYYFTTYAQTLLASNASLHLYLNIHDGREITDISEYLPLSAFFQSALEPVLGRYTALPSRYETFIRNKSIWISDKHFTQQRLAGTNPMSIRQVTIQKETENNHCSVKTTKGECCRFPFTYHGEVYLGCTTDGHDKLWCSTTGNYDKHGLWGDCSAKPEVCSVRTTNGKCCRFPFNTYGKVYKSCTIDRHHRPWCTTVDGQWGNCLTKVADCSVKTTVGKCCHFPFTYRGRVYHTCISNDHPRPWCSTTISYDRHQQWGNCILKPEDCKVKTTEDKCCRFPFNYNGKVYESCTSAGHHSPWCTTVDGQWGNCFLKPEDCSAKTTLGKCCHFPFTYHDKVYTSCISNDHHSPWCSTTINFDTHYQWGNCLPSEDCSVKTTKGECCRFPFTYNGKVYKSCIADGRDRPWCSTTDNYDEHGLWGNCSARSSGLDWNELKVTLNSTFDWETAAQTALQTDDSLEEAIRNGLIYALRYEMCDDMPRSPDLTDRDPRRTMWNFLSPIALFASAKVTGEDLNELVPVAIQMDYKPDAAVYTPSDGGNWMLAKLNLQITDLGYSQIVEHLAKVHYLMEPFCISLKRTLATLHPLNQILKYHCREVVVPNTLGTPRLVGDQGFMDLLFASGKEVSLRLLRDGHKFATWEVTDLRAQIKKRGLADKKLVPYFPYRDDIEEILQVIERMAEDYVNAYYDEEKDVQEDMELQAYANELSINGTGPNGGIGKIQGFPATIDSKKDLVDIMARIISQLTIQHAAVNYELADYAVYAPNLPTKLYNDTRVKDGEFSVYRLPNRLTSATEAGFSNSLASFRFDSLFDYGNELQDIKAVNIINRHYGHLVLRVQPKMQDTNQEREKNGDLTYPYLIPRWIPNGVQT